ncbi:transglycosylase SLT domain-containing protein [Nonomuraea sp. NPDC046802]|uniref:transglycosylase SLT domain-containing protein n=1 Tax=Nonomuraea sp. NPDC046802 TaxID=3154919 RepID=UPI0033E312C0
MSAIDDVRAVPGGAELADRAVKLIGDPDAISSAAGSWRTAASTGRQHTGAVRTAAAEVGDAWQGDSADAFAAYMGKVAGCGDRLQQALGDCAGHLDAAAQALSSAQAQALEICGNYAAAAREQYNANPRPTDAQVLQSMQGALGSARTALDQLLAATGTKLANAAGAIQTTLSAVPNVGNEVAEPDTQPFAPAPGRTLTWSPAQQRQRSTATTKASSSGGGYGAGSPPPTGPLPPGRLTDWINEAIAVLRANGISEDQLNARDIHTIIMKESGGNPHAINNWDSNAAAGHPSMGLMQTIGSTFNAYRLPGHGDVYNPVDNIIAGVRYAISTYGSVSDVPGLVSMRGGGAYRGY